MSTKNEMNKKNWMTNVFFKNLVEFKRTLSDRPGSIVDSWCFAFMIHVCRCAVRGIIVVRSHRTGCARPAWIRSRRGRPIGRVRSSGDGAWLVWLPTRRRGERNTGRARHHQARPQRSSRRSDRPAGRVRGTVRQLEHHDLIGAPRIGWRRVEGGAGRDRDCSDLMIGQYRIGKSLRKRD